MKKILICLLTVCLVLGLVACGGGDKEFTGVELKNSSVVYDGTAKTIAVTGAPEGTDIAYVYKNSAGQTVEEVILPGEYDVTATLTKEGYKELVLTADLTVVPANFSGVAFENRTVTYTGEAIEFAATGVPAGAEATYVIKNSAGETVDEIVNPGVYSVTVKVTKTGYTDKEITATITVEPAEIDGVTFNGMQVTYDGTAKTLTAGNIPQGASVVYAYKNAAGETVQEAVAAGVYTVTATVSMPNHNDKVLTATLTIVPSEITGPSIEDKTVDYNGMAQTIEAADVPADCTVVYVITDKNGDVVDEAIDAGEYKVTATISKPNYKDLVLEATLTISKLDITGITFDDATFAYTGEAVTVSAQGIGEGFTAVYVYKNSAGETVQEAVAAGTYTVTLTVSKSNYNDFTKTITLTITEFDINDIVFQDVTVTYDGESHSILLSEVPGNLTVVYTNNTATDSGVYEAQAVLKDGNSVLKTFNAVLTINKAQAVITAEDTQTFAFDGTYKCVQATLNHSETVLPLLVNSTAKAGTYTVTLKARETRNYLAAEKTVTLTITEDELPDNEYSGEGNVNPIEIEEDNTNVEKVVTSSDTDFNGATASSLEFDLPLLVGNKMLMQANMATRIWAYSKTAGDIAINVKNTELDIDQTFYGKTTDTTNESGKYYFEAFLGKMPYGTDYTITLTSSAKKSHTITDVAFGELYIGSGQSNMGWAMNQCFVEKGDGDLLYQDIIDNSYNENIRLFSITRNPTHSPVDDVTIGSGWDYANPSNVLYYSAAAYFFVREMEAQYQIPVGMIVGCMGGTSIYTWMPIEEYQEELDAGHVNGRTSVDDDPESMESAGCKYFNGTIYPARRIVARGVIWYQGEGHTTNYANNLVAMIKGWRRTFGLPNLLFATVGMPRMGGEETFFLCREQHKLATTMTTGLVYSTNIDTGLLPQNVATVDNLNGDGIHPYEKEPVGRRLADTFMKAFYGAQGTWTGPVMKSISVDGARVIIEFDNVGTGLTLTGRAGFELAGADGKFVSAYPTLISKTTIELVAEGVSSPVKARYGYSNRSKYLDGELTSYSQSVCLYNTKKGEKAYPFDQFIMDDIKTSSYYVEKTSAVDNFTFNMPSVALVALKGYDFNLPAVTATRNGADITASLTAKLTWLSGKTVTASESSVMLDTAENFYLEYFYNDELLYTTLVEVHDFEPEYLFEIADGDLNVSTGDIFQMPQFSYSMGNGEDISIDLTSNVTVEAVYKNAEYKEQIADGTRITLNNDFVLNFYYNGEIIGTKNVTVTGGNTGNLVNSEDWGFVPGKDWDGYGKIQYNAERLYNGSVTATFRLDNITSPYIALPIRGSLVEANSVNPEWPSNLVVAFRKGNAEENGDIFLRMYFENGKTGAPHDNDLVDVNVTDLVGHGDGNEHIIFYSVNDVYTQSGAFDGIKIEVWLDGVKKIDYKITAATAKEYADILLTPATLTKVGYGGQIAYTGYYLGENQANVTALTGTIPATVTVGSEVTLPEMNVNFATEVQKADIYIDGVKITGNVFTFEEIKTYEIEYKYGDLVVKSAQIKCLEAMEVEFTFGDKISDAFVNQSFALPEFTATDFGSPIDPADITIDIRMGANLVATVNADTATYTHDTASVITLYYMYKGVCLDTWDISVGYNGNLIDDTSNWNAGIYNGFRQYNNRVNITFMMTNKLENIFCIPLRVYSSNVDWYGGLCFRPSKTDTFVMYATGSANQPSIGGTGWTNVPSMKELFGDNILNGEYHVFSYQMVDVLNEDYSINSIRLYLWADGKPIKINGQDYYTITTNFQYWHEELLTPAAITKMSSAGVKYSAITFGSLMDLSGIVTMEDSKVVAEGVDYEFRFEGLDEDMTVAYEYYTSELVKLDAKPTEAGEYIVNAIVSKAGYADKMLTCNLSIVADAAEYTISFSGGTDAAGTDPESVTKIENETIVLPANPYTKDGFIFKGWNDGETVYAAGASYTVKKDVQFVAEWEAIVYTELVNDGNFSTNNMNAWDQLVNWGDQDGFRWEIDSTTSATDDGSGSLKFWNIAGQEINRYIAQSVHLQKGVTYNLTCKIKTEDVTIKNAGACEVGAILSDSWYGPKVKAVMLNKTSYTSDGFETFTAQFTAEEDIDLYVEIFVWGVTAGTVWLDDISFIAAV